MCGFGVNVSAVLSSLEVLEDSGGCCCCCDNTCVVVSQVFAVCSVRVVLCGRSHATMSLLLDLRIVAAIALLSGVVRHSTASEGAGAATAQ
jgi:hypothetical protein